MKKACVFILALLLALLLSTCTQPTAAIQGGGAQAAGDPGAKTTEVVNLVVESQGTGDFTRLNDFLAREDGSGELTAILKRHGIFAAQPRQLAPAPSTALGAELPPFSDDRYQDGDVLLCRGSGNTIANLMQAILPRGYGHAGVLWKGTGGNPPLPDFPCVLSAALSTTEVGVCFQTWDEWAVNDSVRVMHLPGGFDGVDAAVVSFAGAYIGRTLYSFLSPRGLFEPVSKENNLLWYCSKVPYRLYLPVLNVENNAFYGSGIPVENVTAGGKWQYFTFRYGTPSLAYEVYCLYLRLCHPFWSSARIIFAADAQLIHVLNVLVTPDELRYCESLVTGDLFGSPSPEQEWP